MARNALSAKFLETVPEPVPVDPRSELLQVLYQDALLTRPLFLEADEHQQLVGDLEVLQASLTSLPDRLFGGDLTAFARALGMNDDQISCVLRGRNSGVTRLSRADLYADAAGFRLLEYNMGSAIGGSDAVDIARGQLQHTPFREFVEEHRLTHVDTLRSHIDTLRIESGVAPGSRPVIALTDWPSSYTSLAPYIQAVARRWSELGVEAHACHIGELTARDGGIWLGERRIDIVNRLFMLEDVLSGPGAMALMDPILDAAERGEVKLFTPLDAELYGCKAAMAMLSDEANRPLFTARELASLDRLLPWTRTLREGEVTLEDGRRVDLVAYALAAQHELALKPTLAHGGEGVVLGWQDGLAAGEWAERVRAAVDGPFVLQRRIRPVSELCADHNGALVEWTPVWGVFTTATVTGGAWIRATRTGSGADVINLSAGASMGSVFHAAADGR
ncbi:hypothetical protein ACFCVY_12795 [Streptomyces sp. NPDC056411]|uniref:hypothetical protein n=1 Tax=Streptomyces sp. NPDC056411 TaxID=3345813 RepID=UPI0035D9DDB2